MTNISENIISQSKQQVSQLCEKFNERTMYDNSLPGPQ